MHRFALRWVAAFLDLLAMTLGSPRLRPEAEYSKCGHSFGPTLGRPGTMAAVMQPHMPAAAREEGQVIATGPEQVLDPQISRHFWI